MFQPKAMDEEADAEEAEDDGGHAREIDDGQADGADDRALLAVFAQVNGAEDAEDERDGHRADDQQDRADNLGPDAARRIVIGFVIGDVVGIYCRVRAWRLAGGWQLVVPSGVAGR